MSDQPETVAAADAAGSQFAKAFLPGLVLGLVVGLFIGAWIPPFFGEKSDLISAPPREPQSAEDRHRGEAPQGDPADDPATQTDEPPTTDLGEAAPGTADAPASDPNG